MSGYIELSEIGIKQIIETMEMITQKYDLYDLPKLFKYDLCLEDDSIKHYFWRHPLSINYLIIESPNNKMLLPALIKGYQYMYNKINFMIITIIAHNRDNNITKLFISIVNTTSKFGPKIISHKICEYHSIHNLKINKMSILKPDIIKICLNYDGYIISPEPVKLSDYGKRVVLNKNAVCKLDTKFDYFIQLDFCKFFGNFIENQVPSSINMFSGKFFDLNILFIE